MKIKGLNGRTYSWNLIGHVPLLDDERQRSSYHLAARTLLTRLYPLDRVLEEIPLPGSSGLTADFFIPAYKLMIEVHGEQHYKFIPHFHRTPFGFIEAKKRDEKKKLWCTINDIILVELPYLEDTHEWEHRIRRAKNGEG